MAAQGEDAVRQHVISIEEMLSEDMAVKAADVTADKMLLNGNRLSVDQVECGKLEDEQQVRLYSSTGTFIAVYQYEEKTRSLKNIKMFV